MLPLKVVFLEVIDIFVISPKLERKKESVNFKMSTKATFKIRHSPFVRVSFLYIFGIDNYIYCFVDNYIYFKLNKALQQGT